MSIWRKLRLALLAVLLAAPMAMPKVYVLWTQNAMPAPKTLGVSDLVIPWTDSALDLLATAKKAGYRVYLQTGLQQADTAAEAGSKAGIAGVFLRGTAAEGAELEESAAKLGAKFPRLKFLVVDPGGKQPEMRGWLVFKQNGILQVSRASEQPWLDQNLALVRFERAFNPSATPLYTFSWDVKDPLLQANGPRPADYSLAIAEAGAFHADLLLEVHERQQQGLAGGQKVTLEDWEQVKRTLAFYDGRKDADREAAVGVLTDDYDTSYEETNLLARHNIPFRVLNSAAVKPKDLAGFDVLIAFAALSADLIQMLQSFGEQGGTVVLVNQPGKYPWDSATATKNGETSVTYVIGKGRVTELGEPVSDPETFAQDVRRLTVRQHVPVSLWNSLTTLVVKYPGVKPGETIVELVNYSEEPTQVQVQVKGNFESVRFASPEKGCCEALKAEHVDGFTQFVVDNLVGGGRVHLEGAAAITK